MAPERVPKTPVILTLSVVAVVAGLIALTGRSDRPSSAATAEARTSAGSQDDTAAAATPILLATSKSEPPLGQFVYLIDISASTKDASGQSAFDEGIRLLQPAFSALTGLQEVTPQRHRVASIGSMSLRPAPRCDIFVARQTLFTATDSLAPARAMRACERSIRQMPAEQYTDISGALVNAGLSIPGKRRALRGILLISDLDEDIPPGTTPGKPELADICVAVFTLVTDAAARQPALMSERTNSWEASLRSWGAKDVYAASVRGFDGAELIQFFRSCEG
jgi:hypothetical protein